MGALCTLHKVAMIYYREKPNDLHKTSKTYKLSKIGGPNLHFTLKMTLEIE